MKGMKRKKVEVNQYANRYEPFHRKNIISSIGKSNFKPPE